MNGGGFIIVIQFLVFFKGQCVMLDNGFKDMIIVLEDL